VRTRANEAGLLKCERADHEVFDVLLGLQEAFLVAGAIQLAVGSSYGLFLLRYWFPQVFAIQQT